MNMQRLLANVSELEQTCRTRLINVVVDLLSLLL